jgi:nucleotide-binding universal stress UspA family protein
MGRPGPIDVPTASEVPVKRVLVGVHGSSSSEVALRWASAVADRSGADLVVVGAWRPGQAELPPDEFSDEHDALRSVIDAAIARVGSSRAAHVEIDDGPAADVLLERADTEDADLLVVGLGDSHEAHKSIAMALAHRATRPLAVVPASATLDDGRVALGIDDADGSPAAAQWCADFAGAIGAPVTAVCVYTHQYEVFPDTDVRSMYGHIVRSLDEEWLQSLRACAVDVDHEVVRERHVPEALVTATQEAGANVLVVGAHGFAPVVHRRLGGVAMRLLHVSPVPVVLVPQS